MSKYTAPPALPPLSLANSDSRHVGATYGAHEPSGLVKAAWRPAFWIAVPEFAPPVVVQPALVWMPIATLLGDVPFTIGEPELPPVVSTVYSIRVPLRSVYPPVWV